MSERSRRVLGYVAWAALVALSVEALLTASLAVGIRMSPEPRQPRAETELPAALFEAEPIGRLRIAPVKAEEATPSPSPSPSPTSTVSAPPVPPPSPSVSSAGSSPVRGLKLTMTGALTSGGQRRIRYESAIENTGDVAFGALVLSSHLPATESAAWVPGGCLDTEIRVRFTYGDGTEQVACVKARASGHQLVFPLPDRLDPGGVVRVVFDVRIPRQATGDVLNHSHVASGSLAGNSAVVVTKL